MKSFDFKSLTPKSDVDLSGYEDALQFVFSNTEIKNVAITGSYGAGKSSVLETFKKTTFGEKYNYLHISLAYFEEITDQKEETETVEEKKKEQRTMELQLEGKILNQLVHKIPVEKILYSNVALKKIPDMEAVINWTLGIVMGILLIIYFICYIPMSNMVTANEFLQKVCKILTKQEFFILAVILGICWMFQIVSYLVVAQVKTRFFKRICIKDSEIELFGDEQDNGSPFSYFDRYLDEIKYLLQNADVDVFVFEDIDRYNTNLIFAKLREINGIINVSSDRPIRFFYLIRDDLFGQKDRAKFFDFIIPILPVVSGHNSFNMFLSYMGKDGKILSRSFIKQISLYIDDMRILNNIYNEYQIYYLKLKEISVGKSAEKIFALVTYKNLFPEDFICLQRGEGFVADLFKEKEKQVEVKVKELAYFIDDLESEIQICNKKIENIQKMSSKQDVQMIREEKWRLERRRTKYKEDINRVKMFSFCDYVEKYGYYTLRTYVLQGKHSNYNTKIEESLYGGVIKFLLTNGYIDENYPDFMVMFHNNEISSSDKKFVRAVLENEPLDYMYPIHNPKIVEEYLQENNLENRAAINFNMFCYYLDNGMDREQDAIIQAIYNSGAYDFIFVLMKQESVPYWKWGQKIYCYGEQVMRYMLRNKVEQMVIRNFGAVLLIYSKIWYLNHMNKEEQNYMQNVVCANATAFERVFQHDLVDGERRTELVAKLADNLKELNWKLPYFEFDMEQSNDIANIIYTGQLYQINIDMIKEILKKWYNVDIDKNESHLYDIIATMCENDGNTHIKLYDYIKENVNTYIDVVIEAHIEINDSSQNLVELLLLADDVHKEILVAHMNTHISSVTDVAVLKDVNMLIQHGKLEYTPENILAYYDLYADEKEKNKDIEFEQDDLLIKYIIGFAEEEILFTEEIIREYGEKNKKRVNDLFVKICYSTEFSNNKYRYLVKCLHRAWIKFIPEDIPVKNIDILIEEDIIEMTEDTLLEMRKKYPKHVKKFIICNIDKYVNEIINKSNFDWKEYAMLKKENISIEYKNKLLKLAEEDMA